MKTNLFRKIKLPLFWRGLGGGLLLCAPVLLSAQNGNGVAVSGLAVNAGTVTFNVSWKNTNMPELWSDTVWVFVDYNNAGKMERLPLLPGATLTTTSPGGKVIEEPDNNKGVWVAGNARTSGSFSATVKLLTAVKNVGGACVYGSNYPPVGMYIFASEISFTGTPDYKVILERYDKSTYTVTVSKNESLLIPNGEAALSFTDKTGAPGVILRGIFQSQGSCTYTEPAVVGTFASFPSTYSGATYVSLMDARDGKVYPVVKVGNRWIMARNLNYQKGLYHNTATNQANGESFTSPANGIPAIGSYWCPGTGTTSTLAACDVNGALYTWETAMMLDGTGTWMEDIKTNTVASAGTYNHGRSAHSGTAAGGRGICPPNWHVPTDAEWGVFFDAVEGSGSMHSTVSGEAVSGTNAGKYSKSACIGDFMTSYTLWRDSEYRGTDSYGFRVQASSYREYDGSRFVNYGSAATFWSSSVNTERAPWSRALKYDQPTVEHFARPSARGYSIRCIRDL